MLVSLGTWAVNFSVGQLSYSASGSTAEVKNYISGYSSAQVKNLVIPATVTYNGTTYNVTKISGLGGTSGASQYVETVRVEYGGHLVTIAKDAFNGCSKLTKVELTSGVNQILADAFKNCPKLTQFFVCHKTALTGSAAIFNKNVNVYVPYTADLAAHKASTVFSTNATVQQSIVPYDFKAGGCMAVVTDDFYRYVAVTGRVATTSTDWTIPEKLTYNNESWTVKSIAPHANHVGDSNLKTLKVSNAINSIGESAFMGNKALTSVSITGVVNKVDNTAFKNCSALTTATMTGVKQLGVEVFSGCTALKTVTFAGHLTTADGSSFAGATNLETITVNNNSKFQTNNGWLYSNNGKTLEFCPPANTKNGWLETVTNIGQAAFANTKQTDVLIPYGVTTVNARAFTGSTSIKRVVVPSSVTSWETTEAFKGCTALNYVICNMKSMPKSYETSFASSNVKNATLAVRPSLLDNYKNDTYWKQFKTLVDLAFDFQSTDSKIGYSVLTTNTAEVTLLTTNTIPGTVTDARGNTYTVTSVGNNAAKEQLTVSGTVTGPNIIHLGDYAFWKCTNLTSVNFPKLQTMGRAVFFYCTNLKTVTLPVTMTSIDRNCFEHCEALTAIRWPLGVKDILNSMFVGCYSLTAFEAPYGVESIAETAFQSCSKLSKVVLPSTVKTVGHDAFRYCNNMTEVIVNAQTPPTVESGGGLFGDSRSNAYLRVPVGCVDQYKNAKSWGGSAFKKDNVTAGGYDFATLDYGLTITSLPSGSTNGKITAVYKVCENNSSKVDLNVGWNDAWGRKFDINALGDSLFAGSNVEKVTLLRDINELPSYCFAHCTGIKNINDITMPDVGGIGIYAFEGSSLTGVNTIPTQITYISTGAFKDCKNLTGMKMPNVGLLGASAFEGCESLSSVELPVTMSDFNKGINERCFKDCKSLTSIRWPLGIKEVPRQAFMNSGLTSFAVPYDGASRICSQAFKNCKSLKSVLLPSTVKIVEDEVFEDCDALSNIFINGMTNLFYMSIDNDWTVYSIFGSSSVAIFWEKVKSSNCYLRVPVGQVEQAKDKYEYKNQFKSDHITDGGLDFATQSDFGLTVTSLPSGSSNGTATAVYLPHLGGNKVVNVTGTFTDAWGRKFDVTAIGDSLFAGSNVTEVTLPSNVTKLPNYCFAYCTAYNPNSLPARITELGDGVFEGCTGLSEMTLTSKVTKIGDRVFAGCKGMTRVELSPSLTRVGTETFAGCENLGTVRIPWGVTSLGAALFSGCTNLGIITIPSSVTSIDVDKKKGGMIDGCKKLRRLVMNIKTPLPLSSDSHYSSADALFDLYVPKGSVTAYKTFHEKTNIYASQVKAGAYDVSRAYSNNVLECFDVKSWDKSTQKGEVVWTQDQFLSNTAEFTIDGTTPREDDWGRKFNITEIADDAFSDGLGRLYDIKLGTIKKIGMRAFKNVTLAKDAQKFDFTRQDNTELLICQDAFRDVNSPSGYLSIIFDGPESADYLPNLNLQNGWFGRYSKDKAIVKAYIPKEQYASVGGQVVYYGNMASTLAQLEVCLIYHPADKSRDMVVETFPVNVSLAGTGLEGVIVTYDDETGKLHEYIVDAIPSGTPFLLRLKDGETWQDRYLLDHTDNLPLISGTPYGQKSIDKGGVPSTASQPGYDIYVYNPTLNKLVNASSDEAQGITDGYYVELPSSQTGSANTIDIEEENLTAIGGVTTIRKADDRLYNLRGQRVDRPTKPGLYILNGKKVVIK